MKYKTFYDLSFDAHPAGLGGTLAKQIFANGYGVSVITGRHFYTSADAPYELAVWKGDNICYDTDVTDDVIGHLTENEVTRIMRQVQDLSAVGE